MGHDKHHKDYNCVCRAVEEIFDAQEAIEEQCPTSCFSNLLNPATSPGRDTVPFILYTKKEILSLFSEMWAALLAIWHALKRFSSVLKILKTAAQHYLY